MTILILEKENEELRPAVSEAAAGETLYCFTDEEALLSFAETHLFQVVFLAAESGGDRILQLAKSLREMIPGVNLILSAESDQYLHEALRLHASGYITGAVTCEKVREELENLLYPVPSGKPVLRFEKGPEGTEIYANGEPVLFRYRKSGELLSILIRQKGRMCSTGWLVEYLWEEKTGRNPRSYLQNIRADLIRSLSRYGLEHIVISKRGHMCINMQAFELEGEFYNGQKKT